MSEHAELPWRSVRNTGVRNDGGYVVFPKAKPSHYPGQDERYEKEIAEWHGNLDFIALTCNSHEALLAACEDAIKFLDSMATPLTGFQQENRRAFRKIVTDAIKKAKP